MSCRNCQDKRPIKIRIPNYGDGMMWFKSVHPFGEIEHIAEDGTVYWFNETEATEAPAYFQKHIYTLVVTEKPKIEKKEEKVDFQEVAKKKGVTNDL